MGIQDVKLADIVDQKLPESAADATVGDMVALAWRHVTPRVSEMSIQDLKDVANALEKKHGPEMMQEPLGSSCCCCCCPCCCCAPCCSCCV